MTAPAADPLARLKYLVGYQLWPKWEALPFREEALAQAQAENDDPRLVAAYILEQICEDAREKAAAASGRAKRIKAGPLEVELNSNAGASLGATADLACARAAALRKEAAAAGEAGGSANPSPVFEPWGLV